MADAFPRHERSTVTSSAVPLTLGLLGRPSPGGTGRRSRRTCWRCRETLWCLGGACWRPRDVPAARSDEAGGSGPERGPLRAEPGLWMGVPPGVIFTQSPCLLSPGWTACLGAGNGLRGPGDPEVATSAHSCTLCTWPFPPRPSTFSARTREVGVGSPVGQRSSGRGSSRSWRPGAVRFAGWDVRAERRAQRKA